MLPLHGIFLRAQKSTLVLTFLSFLGVLGLANGLGNCVRPAIKFLDFPLLFPALGIDFDEPMKIHLDPSVQAVLLYGRGVFDNESAIEHG